MVRTLSFNAGGRRDSTARLLMTLSNFTLNQCIAVFSDLVHAYTKIFALCIAAMRHVLLARIARRHFQTALVHKVLLHFSGVISYAFHT